MSMISEQVKELRELAKNPEIDMYGILSLQNVCRQAADTIESLSAKLQAANMEGAEENSVGLEMGKSILEINTPESCYKCDLCYEYRLCYVKTHDSGCCCGGKIMERVPENGRPEWCPLRESSADCGGGWIPCSTGNMPDMGSAVLIQFKSDMNGITGDDDRTFDISFIRSRDNSEWFCSTGKYPLKAVKAWKPIKSYHEP